MAKAILVLGPSGTGKSTAWRNMPADKTAIITPNSKPMPFKGGEALYKIGKNVAYCDDFGKIKVELAAIAKAGFKYILVEDFTHFMTARITSAGFLSKNTGNEAFSKWNVFGADVAQVVQFVATLPEDVYVVFNHHTETKDDGSVGMRTPGKLLDNAIDIPSYFTYIFHTSVSQKDGEVTKYQFITNTDGKKMAKTPLGCFDSMFIDNDIKVVIDTIKTYQSGEVK